MRSSRGVLSSRRANQKTTPPEPRPKLSQKELGSLLESATAIAALSSGKTRSARLSRHEVLIVSQAQTIGDQEHLLTQLKEENQMLKKRLRSEPSTPDYRNPRILVERMATPATPHRHHFTTPCRLRNESERSSENPRLRQTKPSPPPKPAASKAGKKAKKAVETPGFVLRRVAPSSHQDYREALDTESYDRRHAKHEAEEKKLIRLDKARQREAELRRRLINSPRYLAYTQRLPAAPKDEEEETEVGTPSAQPVRFRDDADLSLIDTVLVLPALPEPSKAKLTRKRILAAEPKSSKRARKPR